MERLGLVGLPNSGKSSLFNALTGGHVPVAPHAFSTTDTTVGVAPLPDHRLDALAELSHSKKIVHAGVEVVDIAGLVAGSATGEGMGNRFLAGIREVDAVLLVLRSFADDEVPGESDPLGALETLELELVMADEGRKLFQNILFSKIVPNCKKLGLLDRNHGWLRQRFTELGVIQFEDWVDTGEEYAMLDEVSKDREAAAV